MDVDLNIKNYTLGELIDIFDLNEQYSIDEVNNITTQYIKLYKKNKSKEHVNFILKARQILLIAIDNITDDNKSIDTDTSSITNEENDTDTDSDNNYNIITNILDDNNDDKLIINNKKDDVNKFHNLNIIRGNINPTLKNTYSFVMNVDSQFRPDLVTPSSNFSFDFSEPLQKVLTYSLINFEIQHCWYIIDDAYGTDKLLIKENDTFNTIQIPQGNYPIEDLIILLNNQIGNNNHIEFSYNKYNNRVSIQNTNNGPIDIIFYDVDNSYNFNINAKQNYNLGWILGFRDSSYTINSGQSIITEGMVDLYGPKYLILSIDDFNNNYINRGMTTMSENITRLNMPSYYTPDLSLNDPNFKFDFITNTWVPSNLTITQAYTIQEINAERQKNSFERHLGPKDSNIFGRVFLERKGGSNFGSIYNASSHLKHIKRTFFGPVNIQRMNVRLYSDKGQLMNLNNQDFSMAFLVEQLYEY